MIAFLFKIWDYDYFKAKDYTAIICCIGHNNGKEYEVDSWLGMDYQNRKEAAELVSDVIDGFDNVTLIVDPCLASSVSMKRLKKLYNVRDYNDEVDGDNFIQCLDYFEQ